MSRPVYIFDIDGTVADINHRLHLKPGEHLSGGDWHPTDDDFIDASVHDAPIKPVIDTLRHLAQHGDIVFVTGRREDWRKETYAWMETHGVPFSEMYMRPTYDDRPDFEVKRDIFNTHLRDRNVVAVFDDRNRVVNMWREIGVPCFQVAPGDY